MRRFLIAGNWKMNCGPGETQNLLTSLKERLGPVPDAVDALVCPPEISLTTAANELKNTDIALGAQNVHFEDNGAFTGEVSTEMLSETGCNYVILGHSERRQYFGETDAIVNEKVKKVLSANLRPVICIGESLEQRKKNVHQKMVKKQIHAALSEVSKQSLNNIVIAYEPIWAIGTGETATPGQAQEMHQMIREAVAELYDDETAGAVRILYGGSMKPRNAKELLEQPDVDGGLIGGASLKADSFAGIIGIAEKLST